MGGERLEVAMLGWHGLDGYVVTGLAIAAGHEKAWAIPGWWFFPCVASLLLGALHDAFSSRRR